LTNSCQSSNDAPGCRNESYPSRRSDVVFEYKIGRQFGEDVSDEEQRDRNLVLVAAKVEVFLQAVQPSVADVDSA